MVFMEKIFEALPLTTFQGLKGFWITTKQGRRIFIKSEWHTAGRKLVNRKMKFGLDMNYAREMKFIFTRGKANKAYAQGIRSIPNKLRDLTARLPGRHVEVAGINKTIIYENTRFEDLVTKVLVREGHTPELSRTWASDTAGFFDDKTSQVGLRVFSFASWDQIKRTYTHEFAHGLWHTMKKEGRYFDRALVRRNWRRIHQRQGFMINDYTKAIRDPSESFSEAYAMYSYGGAERKYLEAFHLEAYEFMDDLFKGAYTI